MADPQGILADPVIHEALHENGFVTWIYDDPFRFRVTYETEIRAVADAGKTPPSLVVVSQSGIIGHIPFDVLALARAARRELRFEVSKLFPGLAPAALEDLDPTWFDALYGALEHDASRGPRGLATSREFLLRELFGLDVPRLDDPAVLLSGLCSLHLHRRELPESLAAYLTERLRETNPDSGWPLEDIIRHRSSFLDFLQQQWPSFVACRASGQGRELAGCYGEGAGAPDPIPFENPTLRTWVSTFFLDGTLDPVPWDGRPELQPDAYRWGIVAPDETSAAERANALIGKLSAAVPSDEAGYGEWLAFAPRWAQLSAWTLQADDATTELKDAYAQLQDRIDTSFQSWMVQNYSALELVPKPIMLHRVLHLLRTRWTAGNKMALLVMDGMAWSQWTVLRQVLSLAAEYTVAEQSVFAWVPTVTPVSRQALFAGVPPREFAASIKTTGKDQAHWAAFWMEHGLDATSAPFLPARHNESREAALTRLQDTVEHPLCRVLAMTVATVDEMSHGAVGGSSALLNQVDHWGRTGWMREGLEILLREGFEVWITADHGNVECVGRGRPSEGALAEDRGARVRTFSDPAVRRMIAEQYPHSLVWDSAGLPEDYLPLVSSGRNAFETSGQTVISHGSIALEEVVVPLVQIKA